MSTFLTEFEALSLSLASAGDRLADLPVELIDEDAGNPRDDFDPADIEGLAATIRERGVLQPVTVTPADQAGRYRLRFGARRLRAARAAGRSSIPAIVRGAPEDPVDRLIEQVVENDQRTPLTTRQMAATVARLQGAGLTQAEIGRRLGRAKDQIAMLSALRDLPDRLADLGGQLGVRTLYELALAWKANPEQVEAWLADRDPETITQAAARGLGKSPAVVETQIGAGAHPPRRNVALAVEVAGRSGRLVLKVGPTPSQAWVLYDGDTSASLAACRDIQLLGLSRT